MFAGLDFSSSELSLPLSVSGAALILWSLFCFPPIQARLGARICAISGLAAMGVWLLNSLLPSVTQGLGVIVHSVRVPCLASTLVTPCTHCTGPSLGSG